MTGKRRPPRKHIPPKNPKPPKAQTGPPFDQPMLLACVDLIGHTGAKNFQMRYSDDEEPLVWIAVATYTRDGKAVSQVAAGLDPGAAAFKLCEELMDGGHCTHCKRPTGVTDDFDPMPLGELVCWYQFDPELKKFRRSCEGETADE